MAINKRKLAPKPAKKKVAAKKAAVKRQDGPTKADYAQLEAEMIRLREAGHKLRGELRESQQAERALRDANLLLGSGLDPHWTNEAVLFAFNQLDLANGPLGAVMAVLGREVEQCRLEAESLEAQGQREAVPALVGAARRLGEVRGRIIDLHRKANEPAAHEPQGRVSKL